MYWEEDRYGAWPTIVEPFFQTHFRNVRAAKSRGVQKYGIPRPSEKEHIDYIVSMYGTLKRFIRDYQSFVQCIMREQRPPLTDLESPLRRQDWLPYYGMSEYGIDPTPVFMLSPSGNDWPPLNEGEKLRLQRGFLRYELCCRLNAFPACDAYTKEAMAEGIDNKFYLLSRHLQRWEEEEIRCVWTYVHRQYQVLDGEVLAEYRCNIRRLSRKARHAPQDEVTCAPNISFENNQDWLHSWTYNMSCLGLPMLQQVLRSDFDDQLSFVKNTAFGLVQGLCGGLFVREKNPLINEWIRSAAFTNLVTTSGANPIYNLIIIGLANQSYREPKLVEREETKLKELGWVFWEDPKRLENLGVPEERPTDWARQSYAQLCYDLFSLKSTSFAGDQTYLESSMFVLIQDLEGELSAKYAVGQFLEAGSGFPEVHGQALLRDRLREVSNSPSKKVSPAFRKICQGVATSG